jgi:hypothetical protein
MENSADENNTQSAEQNAPLPLQAVANCDQTAKAGAPVGPTFNSLDVGANSEGEPLKSGVDQNNLIIADVDKAPDQTIELHVMEELRAALEAGVTDIGDELRQRARKLPLNAFVRFYAIHWCGDMRGLDSSNVELKNLNVVSRHWDGFSRVMSGRLEDGDIHTMRLCVETAISTVSGQPYQANTCKVLSLTVGRLLQFLALPPLKIIAASAICEMLNVIDYEGKGKAAKRVLEQLQIRLRDVHWHAVHKQVQREDQMLSMDPSLTDKKVTCAQAFLELNGLALDALIDPAFVDSARLALHRGNTLAATPIQFPEGALNDPVYVGQIRAILRTYQGLADGNISVTLQRYLPFAKGLRHEEISSRSGLAPGLVNSLLAHKTAGPSNMKRDNALKLDQLLQADGNIFASYAVTTQEVAFVVAPPVMDVILKRISFAERLRILRREKKLTTPEVVAGVKDRVKAATLSSTHEQSDDESKPVDDLAKFNEIIYNQWEVGICLPSKNYKYLVEEIDAFFEQGGNLVECWIAQRPREVLESYVLSWKDCPVNVQQQIEQLTFHNICIPKKGEQNQEGGGRWNSPSTVLYFRAFCQHFFGFLVKQKSFQKEMLSLSLLCDFALVRAFYEFLRERSEHRHYSWFAWTSTWTLMSLYKNYLPRLGESAMQEPYWKERLTRPSDASSDPWKDQIETSMKKAKKFLDKNTFRNEPRYSRASDLVESGIGLTPVLRELEVRHVCMPTLILTPKAAILSRRLVIAILETLQCYTQPVLLGLKLEHVRIKANGHIALKIPKELFRGGTCGGGLAGDDGELEAPEFAHEAICTYLEQSRPILVGSAADGGYLFTTDGGQPMSKHWLSTDLRLMLGYRTTGARQLFHGSAQRNGLPDEDIALRLHLTSLTVRTNAKRLHPEKTRKVNKVVQGSVSRPNAMNE